jgi:hypothetical protein
MPGFENSLIVCISSYLDAGISAELPVNSGHAPIIEAVRIAVSKLSRRNRQRRTNPKPKH